MKFKRTQANKTLYLIYSCKNYNKIHINKLQLPTPNTAAQVGRLCCAACAVDQNYCANHRGKRKTPTTGHTTSALATAICQLCCNFWLRRAQQTQVGLSVLSARLHTTFGLFDDFHHLHGCACMLVCEYVYVQVCRTPNAYRRGHFSCRDVGVIMQRQVHGCCLPACLLQVVVAPHCHKGSAPANNVYKGNSNNNDFETKLKATTTTTQPQRK